MAPQVPLQVFSMPPSLLQLQQASIAQLTSCARFLRQQIPARQAPSPPSQTSQLLREMQLASLAQNLTGFPLVPQVPMTAGSPQQPPFQSSYLPPAQSAMALSREYTLQQLSASRNPPLVLIAPQAQYQSQALQVRRQAPEELIQTKGIKRSHASPPRSY